MHRVVSRFAATAIAAACALVGLQGCADVVVFGRKVHDAPDARPAVGPSPEPARPAAKGSHVVRAVALDEDAATAVGPALDRDALLGALRDALRSRGVLDESAPADTPSVRVTIRAFETHPTSNAVVFGYRPGAGTMTAVVRVTANDGGERMNYDVEASAPLRAPGAGPDRSFGLAPLYRALAERVADPLSGTPGRSDEIARRQVPR